MENVFELTAYLAGRISFGRKSFNQTVAWKPWSSSMVTAFLQIIRAIIISWGITINYDPSGQLPALLAPSHLPHEFFYVLLSLNCFPGHHRQSAWSELWTNFESNNSCLGRDRRENRADPNQTLKIAQGRQKLQENTLDFHRGRCLNQSSRSEASCVEKYITLLLKQDSGHVLQQVSSTFTRV